MNEDEFWEIRKKIGQPLEAMAAQIVSGEEELARQLAEELSPDELMTMVLWLTRLYAFSEVQALQQAGGLESEEARALSAKHFRMKAAHSSLAFGDEQL